VLRPSLGRLSVAIALLSIGHWPDTHAKRRDRA
jgi:hypothetical protein